ncbi:methyltransferase [bacterium]|nr:methyltransferase [candidate division CSSED10-310 bacterium]
MPRIIQIGIPGTERILQIEQSGLKVTQESLYLLKFIADLNQDFRSAGDLGCGSGFLSIGLASLFAEVRITGYEIQEKLVSAAQRNVERNGFQDRISIIWGDIRNAATRRPDGSHDVVVINPPFRKLHTGKMSTKDDIRMSNHEVHGELSEFIRVGSILLKHRGILAVVMMPQRLTELLTLMDVRQVPAFRLQMIHHPRDAIANACLVIGRKGGASDLSVFPPLYP